MDQTAPSLAEIEEIARLTLASVPAPFQQGTRGIAIVVLDWPSDEMLDELEIEDAYELTGLYDGIPLTQKSVSDQPIGPDTIWLFRRPILDEWADRGNVGLRELVTHVTVHELAHHFGWSDDDIAAIDPWWE